MQIKRIMQRELVTVLPSSSIHEAAVKMKKENIGSILVVENGKTLKGILTDRDIAMAVAADSLDPKKTHISKIMTTDPITIKADADIESALRVMHSGNVWRLPVCENKKVLGLLSSADIATELKEEFDQFMGLEEAFVKH